MKPPQKLAMTLFKYITDMSIFTLNQYSSAEEKRENTQLRNLTNYIVTCVLIEKAKELVGDRCPGCADTFNKEQHVCKDLIPVTSDIVRQLYSDVAPMVKTSKTLEIIYMSEIFNKVHVKRNMFDYVLKLLESKVQSWVAKDFSTLNEDLEIDKTLQKDLTTTLLLRRLKKQKKLLVLTW